MEMNTARHWQRAQQHFAARELDAARAACENVIRRQPGFASAHWMLSALLLHAGHFRAATEQALAAAAGLRDEPLNIRLNISWALLSVGENVRALQLLRNMALPPSALAPMLIDAARQCAMIDCHAEALTILRQAIAAGVDGPLLEYQRGLILQNLGELSAAAEAYEIAIRQAPDFAQAHWSLAQLGRNDGAKMRIDRLRRLSTRVASGSEESAYCHYALFRELDRLGDTAAAWPALAEGAKLRRQQVQFDGVAEAAIIDAIIARTGPGFLDARAELQAGTTPIFIVGLPRTGTTLLERILGNHPAVSNCGELNDLRMQYKWVSDYQCPGYLDAHAASLIPALDYGLLARRYLDKTSWRGDGRSHFSDKNQTNFLYCGMILKALPQAKILHLRRNAMDSCFSNLKELFAPTNYTYSYRFDELATHYQNYSRLMSHWHACAPGAILDVSYEDLVSDPETQAQRVLAFCGLSAQDRLTDVTANTQPVSTASSVQVREPIHRRNVDGWRRYAEPLAPLQQELERRGLL